MSPAAWLLLAALPAAGPVPPGRCAVRAVVEQRGQSSVVALTLTVSVRTVQPRTVVPVGGGRAFATDATGPDGKPLELVAGPDGLSAVLDRPGDHTVTIKLDAPVTARGPAGEVGFEVGLPRAAITTLAVKPPAGVSRLTVGVRAADRPGELTRTAEPAAALDRPPDRPGYPLGPAELLVVTWEPPAARTESPLTADVDAAVRVDEVQVETTAAVKVRGPAGDWPLLLPPTADATLDPADGPPAALTRSAGGDWTLTLPAGGAERTVRVTARTARPPAGTPIPVGPLAVPAAARQGGGLRVAAPPAVRLALNPAPVLRRQDAPPDDTVAAYRWDVVGRPPAGPLLTLDARPAAGGVRVKPAFKLKRTEVGWRLDADVQVTPVRAAVDELPVHLPAGWADWVAGPPELVEELVPPPAGEGPAAVRLASAQRAGFALTLSAVYPSGATAREVALPLPTFPSAAVAGATVAAEVPPGLEVVRGAARTAAGGTPLEPTAKPGAAVAAVAGTPDRPPTVVELAWQPHRQELAAEVRAEVSVTDRQVVVTETVRLRPAEPDGKPVRLRGPATAVDVRASPPVEQAGPGEWQVRPPADAREFTLSLRYALPGPPRGAARLPVGLVWPDATATTAHVRVWAAGAGRRVARAAGPWRELPPEPAADRDALPALTLAGAGPSLPLALDLSDPADAGLPAVAADRALVQGWLGDDGAAAVRGRFALRRWPVGGVEVALPPRAANVTVLADKRSAAATVEGDVARVPLPEPRDGRGLVLDVAYTLPAGGYGPVTVPPPAIKDCDCRGPARWQLLPPPGAVLLAGPGLTPDLAWGWRRTGLGPVTPSSDDELDRWLDGGTEPDTPAHGGDAVTGRQAALAPVAGLAVPRAAWVVACSVLAGGVGLLLTRLRPRLVGPAVGLVGAVLAAAAALLPQPTAEAAAAAQPGLAGLAALLAARAGAVRYARWRADHLPGFTRTVPELTATASAAPSPSAGS